MKKKAIRPKNFWSITMNNVNQNGIVKEIELVAGVNKANAIKIFNVFSRLWTQDDIGLLRALKTGIKVTTPRTVRKSTKKKVTKKVTNPVTKKVTRKAAPKTTKKVKKKATTKTTKKAGVGAAKLKTKKKKGKGKKKLKKAKVHPTQETKNASKNA